MEEVIYVLLAREKDNFKIIYVNESEKTKDKDFFTKNDNLKCWILNAGTENNLYLAILPMWKSNKEEREKIVNKIMMKYNPICNQNNQS